MKNLLAFNTHRMVSAFGLRNSFGFRISDFGLSALVLVLALSPASARAQADPYESLAKFSYPQGQAPLAPMEALIHKSPVAEYPAIEAKLVALLQDANTTKDAKRYICRYLGIVGSAACVPAVAELLTDADLSHPARMALEPSAAPEAGAALRAALPKVQGKLLVGVIGSIGARRDPLAVNDLAKYAGDADALVAGTAIAALGQIGTDAAAKVLAGQQVPEPLARTIARAQIEAASRLAEAGSKPAAAAIFRNLTVAQQPVAIRVAALKGLIGTLPQAEAVRTVVETLQGDDAAMRAATIAAYASSSDRSLQEKVAGELPTMKSAGQVVLLGVLADQPDMPVRDGVLKVLGASADEKVRVAALECLARHGEAADVPMIVGLAGAAGPVADAAKRTLQRLGKPGVDATLVQLIESPKASDSTAAMEALASRRAEAALPSLQRTIQKPDPALAAKGAKALGMIGKTENVKDLAELIVAAKDDSLRKAAEEAAIAICRRAADKPAVAPLVLPSLQVATSAAARAALLQVLVFTGGEPALTAVVAAMKDADATVKAAATKALINWPEITAGPHLMELAKTTPDASQAIVALRDGCLRLAEMDELPMDGRVAVLSGVMAVAKRAEEKKRAISILADIPAPAALMLLSAAGKDAALQGDAVQATIKLARQMGAVYPKPALAALEQVKAQGATEAIKQQADTAIKAVQNAGQSPDGFILAWLMTGPITKEGKDGAALFDEVLPPEQPGAKVEWRPLSAPKSGMIEFDKILRGGDNRVAYLKTNIASDKEQDALLEMGSDDGIKVWINGKVVHANNSVRPCTPGSDKKPVHLAKGVNTLLVKVTQGGGQWAACVRLRAAGGKEIQDVIVSPAGE
jgi:HEAT repeat protein